MGDKERKYEEAWRILKATGAVNMSMISTSKSTTLSAVTKAKYIKTYRKALQKEKYNDVDFRIRYPNSKLSSTIDVIAGTINFVLELNDYTNLKEEQFNVIKSS